MAIEDAKIPYEILIRFGDDGRPQGAHVQYRRRIVIDDEIVKDEPLPAEPIDLGGFPTSEIMTAALRDALAMLDERKATIAALEEQLVLATAALQQSLTPDAQ